MDSLLQVPLTSLKGVGQRLADKFGKLNLYQLSDLLFHFPIRYQNRTQVQPITGSIANQEHQFFAQINTSEMTYGRKKMLIITVSDGTGICRLRFFNFSAALKNQFVTGQYVLLFGQVQMGNNGLEMLHPEFQIVKNQYIPPLNTGLTPVYALSDGISQNLMRKSVGQALSQLANSEIEEVLPSKIMAHFKLADFKTAIQKIHQPKPNALIMGEIPANNPYRQRLVVEEIFAQQIKQKQISQQIFNKPAHVFKKKQTVLNEFYNQLPFTPTQAQLRVIKEIETDMAQPQAMLRLLQGDVGAGKTLVAAVVALTVMASGFQVAIMAPTEILAEQHYQTFASWFASFGIQTALLKGKLKTKEKATLLQQLADGTLQFVIGTHALIQDEVMFNKLGLVIIDEQHRFGVLQRKTLVEKGQHQGRLAHQLVMTATPIPRTLAMTAYADLKLSIIDQLPAGRKPVTTFAMSQSRRAEILQKIISHCATGQQVYWVCTLIEESESLQNQTAEATYQLLKQSLAKIKIGLVHGRMKTEQKQQVMQQFKQGDITVLVSTTVIEVGVNVPNATLMVIEDADRLGLAQLHQLRGRVGRGRQQSYCALLYKAPLSDSGKHRLGIMRQTNDGFKIAEKDLQLRGPGEYIGTRQTGQLSFKMTNLEMDKKLIEQCSQFSEQIMTLNKKQKQTLIKRWIPTHSESVIT